MKNLITRSITGIVFISVLISAIYFGWVSLFFVLLLAVLFGADEFNKLVKNNKSVKPIKHWAVIINLLFFVLITLTGANVIHNKYLFLLLPLITFTFIIELYRKKSLPFVNIAYTLLSCFYIAVPFGLYFNLGFINENYSYQILLGFFFILWSNDTGAYLSGMTLGRNKLFERISPKKTWEGSIGGAILSLVIAYCISLFFTDLSLLHWLIVALIIVIFGSLGDLVESLLKRSLHVKDSGNILPGHGGILDRFDGLLLSAPLVYCYLSLIS